MNSIWVRWKYILVKCLKYILENWMKYIRGISTCAQYDTLQCFMMSDYNHQCTAEFPYVCLHVMCAQKKCICYPFFCVLIVTPENPLNCAFEWGQISSLVYCKCALLYTTCAVTWMSLLFTQDVQWHYQKCASYTKLVQSHAPHNTTWNSVTLHSLNSITAPAI